MPFEVPEGWEWVSLSEIAHSCLGKMLDKAKNQGTLQPYLRNVNVRWGTFELKDLLQMPFVEEEDERFSVVQGDLVVCEGGEPGRCAIWENKESIKFQKALHRIRCFNGALNYYIKIVIEWYASSKNIEKYYTGSTIKHLTGESLNTLQIPLPPIQEQHRIVSIVDQWMSLIDLFDTESSELKQSIEKAKSKILDLAIRGELVPQDATDEPALELLKRINPKAVTSCDNPHYAEPYELPHGWKWVELGKLSIDSADGPFGSNLKKEHYTSEKEVRIIQLSNIGEDGWRDENTKYTTFEHLSAISRSEVKPGDVVIAKMMPAGRAILCPNSDLKYVLSSDAVKFVLPDGICNEYILNAINSSVFREQVYDNVQGVTRVRTSLQKLRTYLVPIPPIKEQLRIVSKVNELFSQLDMIEKSLQA